MNNDLNLIHLILFLFIILCVRMSGDVESSWNLFKGLGHLIENDDDAVIKRKNRHPTIPAYISCS